jgi:hypothetical protein
MLASAVAAGSPLGISWSLRVPCPSPGPNTRHYDVMAATNESVYWIDGKRVQRRSRANGALAASAAVARGGKINAITPALALLADLDGFEARDPMTLARRWRVDAKLPAADVRYFGLAGDDVAYVHTRRAGKHRLRTLELLDGKTGKPRWTVALTEDRQIWEVTGSAELVYVISRPFTTDFTVTAYAAADGAQLWSHDDADIGSSTHAVWAVGRELVYERMHGLTKLDDQGAATAIALDYPAIETVAGGVLYAATHADVFAIDLATMKVRWQAPLHDGLAKVALATAGAVYVADGDVLRELDPRGKQVASYGIADETVFGAAGKPELLLCNGARVLALDPSDADLAVQTTVVSGTIACRACDGKPIALQLGDVTGQTDASGHFKVQLTGRGAYFLSASLPGDQHPALKTITLDGTAAYELGTLAAEPMPEGD